MKKRNKVKNVMLWHKAYSLLSKLLVDLYKFNKTTDIGIILLEKLKINKEFIKNNNWFIKFINEDKEIGSVKKKYVSISPIQIYASFNHLEISEQERTKRFRILFKQIVELYIEISNDDSLGEEESTLYRDIQNIDFTIDYKAWVGYNNLNMLEFKTKEKQNEVWECLSLFLGGLKKPLRDYYNDKVSNWYKMDLFSFSVFLYWIDSNSYYPLTKDVIRVFGQIQNGKKIIKSYKDYFKYCELRNYHPGIYRRLVLYSIGKAEIKDTLFIKKLKGKNINIDLESNFKIIGLRIIEGSKDKQKNGLYYKSLKPNILYKFYDCYEFVNESETINYHKEKDINLFTNNEHTSVSVSAIVGKNGAGKSSIFEIIMMIVYCLSKECNMLYEHEFIETGDTIAYSTIEKLNKLSNDLDETQSNTIHNVISYLNLFNKKNAVYYNFDFLNAELYFKTDSIYKIEIVGGECRIYKYKKLKRNDRYKIGKGIDVDDDFLLSFFYSLIINYSIHSLNRRDIGDWIFSLFHKNDSYQTPIVIEPYRKDGNINVNSQNYLVKYRMLSNILEKEKNSENRRFNNSFRRVAEDLDGKVYKDIELLKLNLNNKNSKEIKVENSILKDDLVDSYYKKLSEKFGIEETNNENNIKRYIIRKLITIANRYENYHSYVGSEDNYFKNFEQFIIAIKKDKSHITYKLRQAINYIKYPRLYNIYKEGRIIEVDKLVDVINEIKKENIDLRTIDLVPPPIFDVDIILKDENNINIEFNTLSSGEKQLNYAINSILYHLKNIESVSENGDTVGGLIKYRYVNILLDEVELYFHPEMQRRYLSYLIKGIERIQFNNVAGINICCITHSPYMLSDIPETNILFLNEYSEPIKEINKAKTFGANIHDLLISGFFMDNSIGENTLEQVRRIVNFYNDVKEDNENVKTMTLLEIRHKLNKFTLIVDNIGEDYLRGILKNNISFIEEKFFGVDCEIERHKKELTRLQKIKKNK